MNIQMHIHIVVYILILFYFSSFSCYFSRSVTCLDFVIADSKDEKKLKFYFYVVIANHFCLLTFLL